MSENQTDSTALVTKNAELGKALITEAQRLHAENQQKIVLNEVQRLMTAREEYRLQAAKCKSAIDWYEAKLAALEAGAFDVSVSPMVDSRGALIFHNKDFNRTNF